MTKRKRKDKFNDAKFLLKNSKTLMDERLNESSKMCVRFALMFAERIVNEKEELNPRDLCEMGRECRGWLKESRGFDKAESEAMIAQMLQRLEDLETATQDDLEMEVIDITPNNKMIGGI